jgi:CDGSH-type Zn-finger protein
MASTRITVNANGSLRVEGDFEIADMDGNVVPMPGVVRVSLCRCGHSNNKPFCDGSHKGAGFASVVTAATMNPPKPKPAS